VDLKKFLCFRAFDHLLLVFLLRILRLTVTDFIDLPAMQSNRDRNRGGQQPQAASGDRNDNRSGNANRGNNDNSKNIVFSNSRSGFSSSSSSSSSNNVSLLRNKPVEQPHTTIATARNQLINDARRQVLDSKDKERVSSSFPQGPSSSSSSFTSNLPSEPGSKESQKDVYEFGIVQSLRSAFGFIQSITKDDSYYFSEREFYRDMKVGDIVCFFVRNGPKGLSAQNVRYLPSSSSKVIAPSVKGTVVRSYERHRSNHGLVEVETSSLPAEIKAILQTKQQSTIPFHQSVISKDSLPKGHFLDRGDYVSFTIHRLGNETDKDYQLLIAYDMKFLQTKRDRAAGIQIQRMLEAGAIRELGVVSAIKNNEYGFIRAQDRKDEVYFRMDDVQPAATSSSSATADEKEGKEQPSKPTMKEGIEVEFFVIAEMIRGRLCERAIHLTVIPSGTVQFEVIVVKDAVVTVTSEPGLPPADEIPGYALLEKELDGEKFTGVPNVKTNQIDLWHRCMPDDLILKKGDRLSVNVHYYRPEKIFFARNVKLFSFFPLGRDYGSIVTIKEQSFGFIKSETRKMDLYFKTNQVLGRNGNVLTENELKKGLNVTFDCSVEEGSKLRAIRVKVSDDDNNNNTTSEDCLISKDIVGYVVRNATKKDAIGLIKFNNLMKWKEIQETPFYDPLLITPLTTFIKSDFLFNYEIPSLPDYHRKLIADIIDKQFPTLSYEPKNNYYDQNDYNNNLKTFKIWKKKENNSSSNGTNNKDEKEKDRKTTDEKDGKESGKGAAITIKAREGSSNSNNKKESNSQQQSSNNATITFMKEDYVTADELGPLMNDMEVIFDVYWDRSKMKKVAKNIRLTDEEISSSGDASTAAEYNVGFIDSVINSNYRGGFLRVFKSDEKLFWMMPSTNKSSSSNEKGEQSDDEGTSSSSSVSDIAVDSEVSFELRKRGGLRCAVNVKLLPKGTLSKEETLDNVCTATVVSSGNDVIMIDTSAEPLLTNKYIDLKMLETLFSPSLLSSSSSSNTIQESTSEKLAPISSDIPAESSSSELAATSAEASNTDSDVDAVNNNDNLETAPLVSEERVEYKAKFFPTVPRTSIPIGSEAAVTTSVKPGDLISCKPVVNWAVKRSPIAVNVIDILSSNGIKKKGKIINLKFRLKSSTLQQFQSSLSSSSASSSSTSPFNLEQFRRYRFHELEFTEIQEVVDKKAVSSSTPSTPVPDEGKPSSSSSSLSTYYCLFSEINDVNNTGEANKEPIEVGEEIEFWTIPTFSNIAFAATTFTKKAFGVNTLFLFLSFLLL
jgi:cold shock CspA family protein